MYIALDFPSFLQTFIIIVIIIYVIYLFIVSNIKR